VSWRESVDWIAGKRCECGGSVYAYDRPGRRIAYTPFHEPSERVMKCDNGCGEVYEEDLVDDEEAGESS
jgi:hypothetical protein